MSEVRLFEARPDLVVDLELDEYVGSVIAFVLVTDVLTGKKRMSVVTTGVDEITGRGMVAMGTEMLAEDLAGQGDG